MAKLYAELTSDKGGRVVGKGGNEYVEMQVKYKNEYVYTITAIDDGNDAPQIIVSAPNGHIIWEN